MGDRIMGCLRLWFWSVLAGVFVQISAKRCLAPSGCDAQSDDFCNSTYGNELATESWHCTPQQSDPVEPCTSSMTCGDSSTHTVDGAFCNNATGDGQPLCYNYFCCTRTGNADNPVGEAVQITVIFCSLGVAGLAVFCTWSCKHWGGASGAREAVVRLIAAEASSKHAVEELLWRRCAKAGGLFQSIEELETAAEGALVATISPFCFLRLRPLAAHTCLLVLGILAVSLSFLFLPVVPALIMGAPQVFGCLCRVAVLALVHSHKNSRPLRVTWVNNAGIVVTFVASCICFTFLALQSDSTTLAAGVVFGFGVLLNGNPLLLLRLSVREEAHQLHFKYRSAIWCGGSDEGVIDLELTQFLACRSLGPSPYCRVAEMEATGSLTEASRYHVDSVQEGLDLPIARAQAVATQLLLQVTVPEGAVVGQWLQVKGPGGEKLEVAVPEHALPSGVFTAAVSDGEAHRP